MIQEAVIQEACVHGVSTRAMDDLVQAMGGTGVSKSCLIPGFSGAIFSLEWKEALWAKFSTGAPRPRTPFELQYSDPLADRRLFENAEKRKLRPKN